MNEKSLKVKETLKDLTSSLKKLGVAYDIKSWRLTHKQTNEIKASGLVLIISKYNIKKSKPQDYALKIVYDCALALITSMCQDLGKEYKLVLKCDSVEETKKVLKELIKG